MGLSGPSRLVEDAHHRCFEHGVKCVGFAYIALPLQTNGRLNLLLRRRRSARGSRRSPCRLPRARRRSACALCASSPDGAEGCNERKNACDEGLPVVEKLVHSRMLHRVLKRHGQARLRGARTRPLRATTLSFCLRRTWPNGGRDRTPCFPACRCGRKPCWTAEPTRWLGRLFRDLELDVGDIAAPCSKRGSKPVHGEIDPPMRLRSMAIAMFENGRIGRPGKTCGPLQRCA